MGSRGGGGPPPGLRGRDIGLYYRNQSLSRRSREGGAGHALNPEQRKLRKIQSKLRDHTPEKLILSPQVLDEAQLRLSRVKAIRLPDVPPGAQHTLKASRLRMEQVRRKEDAKRALELDVVGEEEILREGAAAAVSAADVRDWDETSSSEVEAEAAAGATEAEEHVAKERKTHRSDTQSRQSSWRSRKVTEPLMEQRIRLPAWKMKDHLCAAVRSNQVVVVSSATGAGKTTQVPQFLLDDCIERGEGLETNIICTQPRRISASSVAERVAAERGEIIGGTVGYQIRLEANTSMDTRLLFCTTGILLRRLQGDELLEGVTHVIVDEIHERSIDADFLLIILRDLLPLRPDLRVVLMSATLNADMFSSYFGGCPTVHIPGFTFPVTEYFLEDAVEVTGYIAQDPQNAARGPGQRFGAQARAKKRELRDRDPDSEVLELRRHLRRPYPEAAMRSVVDMQHDDKIPFELILALLEHIDSRMGEGAVLVFLPGWDDISKMHDACMENKKFADSSRYLVLPLHSSLPTANQRRIFDRPARGVRKIILATNIAETSLTIDDIVFVIDSGRFKEKTYDPATNVACLLPAWVSKASAKQRRGRAGRVQKGICFHLFSSLTYENLKEYQEPEMLRTPLESLCLQVKSLGLADVEEFLGRALESPDSRSIANALELLRVIGAIRESNGDLTPLGKHLAGLPVDPRLGKMLLYAVMCRCLDPVLTIASSLGFRNPFTMPLGRKEEADRIKAQFAEGRISDHGAYLAAFDAWQRAGGSGRGGQGRGGADFAWRNFLSHSTLCMIEDMKEQFLRLLRESGLLRPLSASNAADARRTMYSAARGRYYDPWLNKNSECWPLVKGVLTAGLFPSVARIDFGRNRCTMFTKNDGVVKPHPGSSNDLARSNFSHRWALYYEKVRSSDLFLHDTTEVSPVALCLFGGPLELRDPRGELLFVSRSIPIISVRTADEGLGAAKQLPSAVAKMPWVYFEDPVGAGEVVQSLRVLIEARLTRALVHPTSFPLYGPGAACDELMSTLLLLLEDSERRAYHRPSYACGGDEYGEEDSQFCDADQRGGGAVHVCGGHGQSRGGGGRGGMKVGGGYGRGGGGARGGRGRGRGYR